MGAETFMVEAEGKTAREAFQKAVEDAQYENGHGGYTNTITEKNEFMRIAYPPNMEPKKYAQFMIDSGDARVDDKWGPAGCIKTGTNKYLFFGWASS